MKCEHKVGEKVFVCVRYESCTHSYMGTVRDIIGPHTTPFPYRVEPLHPVARIGEGCGCNIVPGNLYLVAADEISNTSQTWEM